MNWTVSHNDITNKIISIEQSILNPIVANTEVISYLKELLWTYREQISKNDFTNKTEEITFFKLEKPIPLSYLIQHRKQLEFEIEYKNYTSLDDSSIIEKETNKARKFITKHHNFMIYMEMKRTNYDEFYFLRKNSNENEVPSGTAYNFDKLFCTTYDCLWAELIATNRYIEFLSKKAFKNHDLVNKSEKNSFNINWTGSKVALTELAIALKYSGSLNNGNISFKDTILFLQNLFNTDLGEFHHTAMRLKNRSQPTKFMDNLKLSVENWMEKSDS